MSKIDYKFILKQLKDKKNAFFLSDWNSTDNIVINPKKLNKEVFRLNKKDIDKYFFIEDTYDELLIKNELLNNKISKDTHFAIGANATSLLASSILSLSKKNIKNFLIISPVYFSIIDNMKFYDCHFIISNISYPECEINFQNIKTIIQENKINAIIATDPFYCIGRNIAIKMYNELIKICNEYDCFLLIDYSRGGASWSCDDSKAITLLPIKILNQLETAKKYILIDSVSKRIMMNGLKVAMIFSNNKIITNIINIYDSSNGSMSILQKKALYFIYKKENQSFFLDLIFKNIEKAKRNFYLLETILYDNYFTYIEPDDGFYFTMGIKRLIIKGKPADDKRMFKILLNVLGIYVLPNELYELSSETYFLFRINLLNDIKDIIEGIKKIKSLYNKPYN